jgi:NAD(P)H-dependent FMN reductase
MSSRIRVALIYGSTREGRFCDTVADWAATQIASRSEFALDVIDPAAPALPVRHEREGSGDLVVLRQRIARADAFVIVTPEYHHGYRRRSSW